MPDLQLPHLDYIKQKDPRLAESLQAVQKAINSISYQTASSPFGTIAPPHPVTAIAVSSSGGFAQIALTHNNAPVGSNYLIQMSSTPNFTAGTTSTLDNGTSLTHPPLYLGGKTVYFRAAAKFPGSSPSAYTYLGGQTTPTPITFPVQNPTPSGLLTVVGGGFSKIQAGSGSFNNGATVTFPTPFTTLVAVTLGNHTGSCDITSSSNTGFVIATSSNPQTIEWIAVGT